MVVCAAGVLSVPGLADCTRTVHAKEYVCAKRAGQRCESSSVEVGTTRNERRSNGAAVPAVSSKMAALAEFAPHSSAVNVAVVVALWPMPSPMVASTIYGPPGLSATKLADESTAELPTGRLVRANETVNLGFDWQVEVGAAESVTASSRKNWPGARVNPSLNGGATAEMLTAPAATPVTQLALMAVIAVVVEPLLARTEAVTT